MQQMTGKNLRAATLKRWMPGQHLIGDDTKRVEVRTRAHSTELGVKLLRGHVGQGTDLLATADLPALRLSLGQAEIHECGMPIGADDDVRRLDIAVQHSLPVSIVECAGHLIQHGQGGLQTEALRSGQEIAQGPATQELHDDEQPALGLNHVMHDDDVGMAELGRCLSLAQETFHELRIHQKLRVDHLERHRSFQHAIPRPVYGAEPATAELGEDFVFAESSRL